MGIRIDRITGGIIESVFFFMKDYFFLLEIYRCMLETLHRSQYADILHFAGVDKRAASQVVKKLGG